MLRPPHNSVEIGVIRTVIAHDRAKLAPSILAADVCRLGEQVAEAENAGANRIQVDVMDGMFVPNISFGIPVVEAVRRATALPIEAHLMIVQPDRYLDGFAKAGADTLIVHQEACTHLHRTIEHIRDLGKSPGVALNPATSVGVLEEIMEYVDLVLIMTVNPGFGGQRFIRSMLPKVSKVRNALNNRSLNAVEVEVDGGVDCDTLPAAAGAGADVFVAGSSVFNDRDPVAMAMERLFASVRARK